MSERQKLKTDWQSLEMAFEFSQGELGAFEQAEYFDLKTGQRTFDGIEVHGEIRLDDRPELPDKPRVYVVVPYLRACCDSQVAHLRAETGIAALTFCKGPISESR